MLSERVLDAFSHAVDLASSLYVMPSSWNPRNRLFEPQTLRRKVVGEVIRVLDIVWRIWCNIGYGWMVYNYIEAGSIIQILIPGCFVCSVNWCWNARHVSYGYRVEIEQFVNGLLNLNKYLAKELKVEDKDMPKQKLLEMLILTTEFTAVFCTLACVALWGLNYLNCNAYIYWFGMTPGRFIYTPFMVFWIFWNFITYIYILLVFLYLTSIYMWLTCLQKKFIKREIGFHELLHYYRCIETTHILFSRALATFYLPVGSFLSQLTLVVTAAVAILFYDQLPIITIYTSASIISTHIFVLVTVTKISSLITVAGLKIMWELKNSKVGKEKSIYDDKVLKRTREMHISIGSFYPVEPGTLLVSGDIVLDNLISLLLGLK